MSTNESTLFFPRTQPDESPLLALPAEIRNMICEYTFRVDHIQAIQYRAEHTRKINNRHLILPHYYTMIFETRDRDNWRTVPQQLSTHLALAKTCRQLNAEIKLLPFTQNVFEVAITSIQHFCAVVPRHILHNIKVIRLWNSPEYRKRYSRTTSFLEMSDTDDPFLWMNFLKPLRELPALDKVFIKIRGGARILPRMTHGREHTLKVLINEIFRCSMGGYLEVVQVME